MDYKEFLEDRLKGIGGSDAPIILGRCPYQTPFSVWQIKTRKKAISLDRSYPATRGTNLEPAARSMYEINHGDFEDFPSKQFIHKEYNYLFANLDGWNEKKKIILEIKCPLNKERHQDASNGVIPEHYIDQLQHQLFVCTEAEKLHYFSYDDRDHTGYLVEVERDPTWAEENLEKLKTFWEYNVLQDIAPELDEDRDYLEVKDAKILSHFNNYKQTRDAFLKSSEKKQYKDFSLSLLTNHLKKHPRLQVGDIKIYKTARGYTIR